LETNNVMDCFLKQLSHLFSVLIRGPQKLELPISLKASELFFQY
jgi:hypothetical protein